MLKCLIRNEYYHEFGRNIVQYFKDHHEYVTYTYRHGLWIEAVKLGVLLLIFFFAQQGIIKLTAEVIKATGTGGIYSQSSAMQLLFSGAISTLVFFLFSAVYCLIRRMSFARLFPFERIGGAMLAMLCVVGLTFSLMSNYAASLVTDVFSLFGVRNRGGDVIREGTLPSVFLYYLTVAVLPALAEEFAFRGVVMGSLRKYSDALALVISSAAFALMHGNFVQIPFTFCCGLAFGFIAIRTNSLLPAIIIHFFNNALSVTYDVLTSYGIISYAFGNLMYGVIITVLCILSFFFIRRIIKEKPELLRFDDSDRVIPFKKKMRATVFAPTMLAFAAVMLVYAVYELIG